MWERLKKKNLGFGIIQTCLLIKHCNKSYSYYVRVNKGVKGKKEKKIIGHKETVWYACNLICPLASSYFESPLSYQQWLNLCENSVVKKILFAASNFVDKSPGRSPKQSPRQRKSKRTAGSGEEWSCWCWPWWKWI